MYLKSSDDCMCMCVMACYVLMLPWNATGRLYLRLFGECLGYEFLRSFTVYEHSVF